MDFAVYFALVVLSFAVGGNCDKPIEEDPVPIPYAFSYTAGRMPGHTDRVHAETSDGNGVIRGMFSYIDPRYKIRTVEYVADKDGFHPIVITNPVNHPRDTPTVEHAKVKHLNLYQRIAEDHARIAAERESSSPGKDVVITYQY
ncbi:UNVERIFIED_CONTAM: hypothetical protein PYX00_009596 [Menopon gallinae]|uniref:Uncharacterized protein n=1 Tax=Menopon gallinae TaxID=328185 RepID=A0AAW2HC69_9NEOP